MNKVNCGPYPPSSTDSQFVFKFNSVNSVLAKVVLNSAMSCHAIVCYRSTQSRQRVRSDESNLRS